VKNVGANVVMNVVMNVVTNVVTASLQCFIGVEHSSSLRANSILNIYIL
jgi:hypothetical protein